MKNIISASFVLAVTMTLPLAAQAQKRMNKEELIAWATEKQACGEDRSILDAYYTEESGNEVRVQCGDATGFLPLAGGIGLGGAAAAGVGLAAIAAGGGGSTGDTQ